MEKRLSLGALVLASTVLLAACGNVGGGASSTGTKIGKDIKVGYNWELSGNVSSYGNSMKNGADLAVKEINAAGGVGGKKLKVLSQDNKSENAEAATVATNLVTKGAKTSIDLKKALAKLKDFKGVTGKMSIDKNHNVVKSAYVVKLDDGKTSSVNIISAK
ncbi:TPA: ABC transporter substrate-binding protein [Streptococcus agalactiae]